MIRAARIALCLALVAGAAAALEVRPRAVSGATEIEVAVGDAGFALRDVGPRQFDLIVDGEGPIDLGGVERTALTPHLAALREAPEPGKQRLRFVMSCDCVYEVAMAGGRMTLRLTERNREAAVQDVRADEAPDPPLRFSATAPARAPAPFPRGRPSRATAPAADADATEDVALARRLLLQQLVRAADQGLVDFASDQAAEAAALAAPVAALADPGAPLAPEPEATAAAPEGESPAPRAETPRAVETAALPQAPVEVPVRARTARDRDYRGDRRDTLVRVAPCLPDERLDLADWRRDRGFRDAVAAWRARLLDEHDEPRPEAVRALAQTYILHGFGAEAGQLLRSYGGDLDEAAILIDLAMIVDGVRPRADGPVALSGPCGGAVALWRLAGGLTAPGVATPEEEILSAFAALPTQVRALIAPGVIRTAIDTGAVDLARRVDLLISRSAAPPDAALDFARAELLAASGDAAAAETLYGRLARRNQPESQAALIRLLDSLAKRGAPIPRELADALTVASRLARGAPNEAALKIAEARARAMIDGPAAALARLSRAIDRLPEDAPMLRDAAHAVFERIRPGGEAADLAKIAMSHADLISDAADGDDARRALADALTEAGLANMAMDILDSALARGAPLVRGAAARALLSQGRAEEALAQVSGLDAPDALRLRAEALERLGRHGDAFAAATAAGPEAADAARALRAGAWAAAAGEDPSGRLAAYMADRAGAGPPPHETDEEMLERAARMLQASEDARTTIKEALTDG